MDRAPSRIENPVDGEESKLLLHRFDWIETRVFVSGGKTRAMEPCAATVKGPQRSSLGLHTASAGNNVRSSINLLCHKLAPVRALASFFGSNTDIFRPIISVFKLPDEIVLSILSHISPDP